MTGGGSNLRHLRQLANFTTGFDSRIGFANEYVANDKNQHLKGPEYATSIGLLMESLKIRDKKNGNEPAEEIIEKEEVKVETNTMVIETPEFRTEEQPVNDPTERRRNKLTIGQKIMESVKKFFEEVE